MKIKVINPNTTLSITKMIGDSARQIAAQGTEIHAVSPRMGPATIESYYDDALSVVGVLDEVQRGEQEGVDGYVIACFGDPGLYAARELANGPVIGMAEAAMHAASLIGTNFSIVTTLERTCGMSWHLAERYGMKQFCRQIRACGLAVDQMETTAAYAQIAEECKRALHEDKVDSIILGCAGMSDFCAPLSNELGINVIDGVTVAVKLIESLVTLNLKTSKHGDWAAPPLKKYTGILDVFTRRDRND